jgi:hypothetical protein
MVDRKLANSQCVQSSYSKDQEPYQTAWRLNVLRTLSLMSRMQLCVFQSYTYAAHWGFKWTSHGGEAANGQLPARQGPQRGG